MKNITKTDWKVNNSNRPFNSIVNQFKSHVDHVLNQYPYEMVDKVFEICMNTYRLDKNLSTWDDEQLFCEIFDEIVEKQGL